MANYLVLGGSGFIGSSLVKFLEKHNNLVTNLDIAENPANDLRHLQIDELQEYDACFFLAWDVGGAKYINSKDTWENQFQNNLRIITNVIPQIKKSGIPTLFVSSQLAGVDNTPYSLTKLIGEQYCGIIENCVIARQWNVFGSYENPGLKSHVISDFIHQALHTGTISMMTNGNESRRFIHLEDVSVAYMTLINQNLKGVFDVCGDNFISIYEVATIISNLTGAKIIRGNLEGKTHIIKTISKIPNWKINIELENGIKTMIDAMRK